MTIEELADEYQKQYESLTTRMNELRPLLDAYTGKELYLLRKRIMIYYDMACECKRTVDLLNALESEAEK